MSRREQELLQFTLQLSKYPPTQSTAETGLQSAFRQGLEMALDKAQLLAPVDHVNVDINHHRGTTQHLTVIFKVLLPAAKAQQLRHVLC
jgi:hypothetical protein